MPFNCLFGAIAALFSLLSLRSTSKGDFNNAKIRGNIAKWLSIIGIAVSLVILAFVIVYFVYIDKNIVDTPGELSEYLDQPAVNNNGSLTKP